MDGAGDEVAFAVDEFFIKRGAFGLADFLQDDLLGGLRRNAPKTLGRMIGLHHDDVVDLRFWVVETRRFQSDFGGVSHHFFHHFFFDENAGAAGLGVDLRFNRLGRAGARVLAKSRNQGALQSLQHNIGRQSPHLGDLIEGDLQFVGHDTPLQKSKIPLAKSLNIKQKVGLAHFFCLKTPLCIQV